MQVELRGKLNSNEGDLKEIVEKISKLQGGIL